MKKSNDDIYVPPETEEDTLQHYEEDDPEDWFLMSNLPPTLTGLPYYVWIQNKGGARHDVRVKCTKGLKVIPSELISVAIRPNVRVTGGSMNATHLGLLSQWLNANHGANFRTVIDYWDGMIDTQDMMSRIVKIA